MRSLLFLFIRIVVVLVVKVVTIIVACFSKKAVELSQKYLYLYCTRRSYFYRTNTSGEKEGKKYLYYTIDETRKVIRTSINSLKLTNDLMNGLFSFGSKLKHETKLKCATACNS